MAGLNCSVWNATFSVASRPTIKGPGDSSVAIYSSFCSIHADCGSKRTGGISRSPRSCGVLWRKRGSPLVRATVEAAGEKTDASVEDSPSTLEKVPRDATDVVLEFYELINAREFLGLADLFAEDCVYEDYTFPEPAKGKEEVLKFFEKIMSSFGKDLQFVIDDITRGDPNAVGVTWHLDMKGKAFPFSRGCSFYRCEVNSSGTKLINYARDIVESPAKPGYLAMGLIKLLTSLFERNPQLLDRF